MFPPLLQAETAEPARNLATFLQANWPLVIVAVLAGVAIFLLLPRPRNYPPLFGAIPGALAIVLLGIWLIRAELVWVETLLFYSFSGLAILFGGLMITQSMPVRAALSFAMVVLSTCGLFLLQAAPFLMVATIIIYAGAIVVTFLFVIMLAQQSGLSSADHRSREPLLSVIAGFVLLASLWCVLHNNYANAKKVIDTAGMEKLVQLTQAAGKARDLADLKKIVGNQGETLFKDSLEQVQVLSRDEKNKAVLLSQLVALEKSLYAAEEAWAMEKLDLIKEKLKDIHEVAVKVQQVLDRTNAPQTLLRGSLLASPNIPVSALSGVPANQIPKLDRTGKPAMPADNVSALGRSLFTDYLVSVELAATLLLVATIGAIAIAGRRTEGLK